MSKQRRVYPKLYKVTTFKKSIYKDDLAFEIFYTVAAMNRKQAVSAAELDGDEFVLSVTCVGRAISKCRAWKTTEGRP